jgi:hypothetical protein
MAGMANSLMWAGIILFAIFIVFIAVWVRWRHQGGGGYGPTEFSDGSMTITATGYPEEMKGSNKRIEPIDAGSADYR